MSSNTIERDVIVSEKEAISFIKDLLGLDKKIPVGRTLFNLCFGKTDGISKSVVYKQSREKIAQVFTNLNLKERKKEFLEIWPEDEVEAFKIYQKTLSDVREAFEN